MAMQNLIDRFSLRGKRFTVLTDDAFRDLGEDLCAAVSGGVRRDLSALALADSSWGYILLICTPQSYLACQLYRLLDFSLGEPVIPNVPSRVWVFPRDSLQRILSAPLQEDIAERDRLLALLPSHRRMRIRTQRGTDLTFQSRSWIPLDFEVCTAPVEESVNGRIVVDGALFFQKIHGEIILTIRQGRLTDVSGDPESVELYRSMTQKSFADPRNRQLAEIGFGFCQGAQISDCFMEAEAVRSSCHFCFGNNVCYGGENASDFHGNSVLIREPVI